MTQERVEHDTMGAVKVPAGALWGAQTQRAVENFPISGEQLAPQMIWAIALIKRAAAQANGALGILPPATVAAIEAAADSVVSGEHRDQFPVDVFQTGSGTSSNMNMNEVLAALAGRALGYPLHPNDILNASQSSNDVFPSAIHLAALQEATHGLLPALAHLQQVLADKGSEFADVVKAGRTHLMDAVPVTLGAEFAGYSEQVRADAERITSTLPRVAEIPLGGTAVGTGLGAPVGWRPEVVARLANLSALPVVPARDPLSAQSSRDAIVELSGQLRVLAVSLTKICNDLRWMGSGPRTGLAEIGIPDLQPGSSIMPGKVNPVVPEAVLQVCAQVVGNDAAITWGGAAGAFELNVMLPLIARNILHSLRILVAASRLLADRCVVGIVPATEKMLLMAQSSPAIVTGLSSYLGYEEAAAVAKQALAEGSSIHQVVIDRGHVAEGRITAEQLTKALDVRAMAVGQ